MIWYQCYRCEKRHKFADMEIILRDHKCVCKACYPALQQEIKDLAEIAENE